MLPVLSLMVISQVVQFTRTVRIESIHACAKSCRCMCKVLSINICPGNGVVASPMTRAARVSMLSFE